MKIASSNFITLLIASILLLLGIEYGSMTASANQNFSSMVTIFEDHFDGEELGNAYEVIDPDSDRLALDSGKLLVVASMPQKNIVMLNQKIDGNFIANIKITSQISLNNSLGLTYIVDGKNYLVLGVAGADRDHFLPWEEFSYDVNIARRQPFFMKVLGGNANSIREAVEQLGDRNITGLLDRVEDWYLELRRSGSKYTGRISTDGVNWINIGTHVIVQKYGRLGLTAASGGGIENAVEFDDFVVQGETGE